MEKLITYENLRLFAYCNDQIVNMPIRGIALQFFGLNGKDMYKEDTDDGRYFANQGILLLIPYYNPWCWMNREAVALTDELVDVLIKHFHLPENLPIVSSGGSMGGLSALTYMVYAKRTPVACVANCPVCDLKYHFTERSDLPRTLYSAFYSYDGTMEEALMSASPLHLVTRMPEADYYIFHCEEDQAVDQQLHSDRFVSKLKKLRPVIYHSIPGRGHCDLPDDAREQYMNYITQSILDRA